MRRIKFYETRTGRIPFQEWLDALFDRKTQNRIERRLTRVESGNFGDCKAVGSGVWEIRIDFGPGYRIYYALDGDTVIVLLCGGDKATQSKDIEKAIDSWRNYKENRR